MSSLFEYENAAISIGAESIIHNLNWKIVSGKHTWISGKNGSGKTTLCQNIGGEFRIAKGKGGPVNIGYEDIRVVSFTDDGKLFHSVNNVHYYQQRFNAWDADGFLKVRDYLLAKGIDLDKRSNLEFLVDIGIYDLLETERIKLSSGQTRKMLLASALLKKPALLILDNAYIGLDTESRNYLNDFLDELVHKSDITLIISGHTRELPNCITERLEISNGQLLRLDDGSKIKSHTGNDFINNDLEHNLNSNTEPDCSKAIEFNNVNIGYNNQFVINNLNWSVCKGEKWSLFGPNGSGKSTIVSLIYADHPQIYSQNIRLFGERPGPGCSIWDIKKRIGFTSPELHAYFRTDYTAKELVLTGLFDKFEIMSSPSKSNLEYAKELFRQFGLKHLIEKNYSQLSTGHQRMCLLMRALIKKPELLLLDEPFQGLDQENVKRSKDILNDVISADQTLVFISHFKNEIPEIVDSHFNLID